VSGEGFFGLLARQLRADLGQVPRSARDRMALGWRAQHCVNIAELSALAARRLPRAVFDYIDGAAGDELTARRNCDDLRSLRVLPRVLAGGAEVDLSTTVLGERLSVPLLGAPTGLTGLLHHSGEVSIARAVHGAGSLYVLSSAGSRSIADVARLSPGPLWFQLYVGPDRGLVRTLLEQARSAGYRAIVLTVDVPRGGSRERDARNGFTIPPRVTASSLAEGVTRPRWSADFLRHPRIISQSAAAAAIDSSESMPELMARQFDPALSWSDVAWLQEQWNGPVVLKGVLRADDASQAARLGISAVVVSNHGGRQLDHAPSAIEALPAIVAAVGDKLEVYMDGGIRRGVDILKALALGARACLSGRALLYGLAAGGPQGAARAMDLLVDELSLAMMLAGARSIAELDRSFVTTGHDHDRGARWSTA
jgi:L-lactate dehydrogenase (cytochrome)